MRFLKGTGCFFIVLFLGAGPAFASASFPEELRRDLALSQTPPCTICHVDGRGGFGTAILPFAVTLRSKGATAVDLAALRQAIDAVRAANIDSDGDGVGDIEELIGGTNPSGAGARVQYGCSAPGSQALSVLALLAALSPWRRRRR